MVVNEKNLGEYKAFRNLAFRGVTFVQSEGLWKLQLPNGLIFLARHMGDAFTVYECFFGKVYGSRVSLEGRTVIDIGAGIADSAIHFASLGATVFAFEPHEESFSLARKNVELNKLQSRVFLFHKAVSANEGVERLMIPQGEPHKSVLMKDGDALVEKGLFDQSQNVETATLDKIIQQNGLNKIDILKLDCEGAEFDILNESSSEALSKVRKIVLEYHRNPVQLIRFLSSLGFKVNVRKIESGYVGGRKIYAHMGILNADHELSHVSE
jgi:FkbM family methyltransferase